jgi:serine phosphatase RsbU (regulator of sigma subunit)
MPQGIEGVCFANFSSPSQGVDGDFFEVRRLHASGFEVLVGDVMGKGVPAALIGAGIKTSYYQVLANLMSVGAPVDSPPTPAQIVNELHQMLTPQLTELAAFATLALYRFDLCENTLCYVNAGHTPGLLQRQTQHKPVALLGENPPIGVLAAEVYTQSSLALAPGDKFLFFSDGVTEARNAQGELFGLGRLSSLFEAGTRGPSCSCATQIEAIRQALQLFSDSAQVPDDQTLFMIELASRTHEEPVRD